MIETSNLGGGIGSNSKTMRGFRRLTRALPDVKKKSVISPPAFYMNPPASQAIITPRGNMGLIWTENAGHPLDNANMVPVPNAVPSQLASYVPLTDPTQNYLRVVNQTYITKPGDLIPQVPLASVPETVNSTPPSEMPVLPHPSTTPPSPAQLGSPDPPKYHTTNLNSTTQVTTSINGQITEKAHSISSIKPSTYVRIGKLDHFDIFSKKRAGGH